MRLLSDFLKSLGVRRSSRAQFTLLYRPGTSAALPVGVLEFDGNEWTFRYEEAYRQRTDLRALEGFENLNKVYRSPVLFPFFAMRVPDRDRPDIERILKEKRVSDPDVVDLLRLFGERSASSPGFQLVASAG